MNSSERSWPSPYLKKWEPSSERERTLKKNVCLLNQITGSLFFTLFYCFLITITTTSKYAG